MFSKKYKLLQKTGPDGIGRYDYLRLLKKEFEETLQEESKQQVLANLANFSYDPINYDYIRSLHIIDLFLEQLESINPKFVIFAISGLCNLSSDPTNRDIIVNKNGIDSIHKLLLNNQDEEVLLNSVTTLMFLSTEENQNKIGTDLIKKRIKILTSIPRLANICTIFLERNVPLNPETDKRNPGT